MNVERVSPVNIDSAAVTPENRANTEATVASAATAAAPEDVFDASSGGVTVNGVTAYLRVQQGSEQVYALVDDATGRVMRQVPAGESLPVSSAIEEILNLKRGNRS